ncbi:o-succinylbenzoate synthase [Nakamurella endophytica]|uniref:o-succinylbenzoate synthase n=1 Tax=Nakamurella endophytica TaxID=1748367 RepID=A0A917T0L5_9ACTN|nr:o-succinylbenzoate synthase [Nakamurella endophytica]GGM03989.1 o-succinylbenzoate synthase [Nakamurella endophytica]
MRLRDIELRIVRMPLRSPFRTSFGVETEKVALLVRVRGDLRGPGGDRVETGGWGECVAMEEPLYSAEYVAGAVQVTRDFLAPRLFAAGDAVTAERVGPLLAGVVGHRMAKAAVEMAVLDAELRARGVPLAEHLGAVRDRVPSGVSVGIQPSVPELLDVVAGYLDEGYVRIKLKIAPGWVLEPVRAVRERWGDDLLLQVDANAAFTLADAPLLQRLDELGLLLIEQPLAEDDLVQHAELARMLRTPVCLDESVVSARAAADAIRLGAARVINVKPGRVGGYLEARRVHDVAVANGVAVWCGGMLETGLGRAANAALAALPGFTLPGDVSASSRFYETDLTRPFVLEDGHVAVPTGPGLGVEPVPELLAEWTSWRQVLSPDGPVGG